MADKVPRIIAGVDIRQFKLDPMDGFLLTRIDGKLGPRDLARETGLPDFSVSRTLEKLEKLGIVQIIDPNAPPPPPAPPPEPTPRQRATASFDAGLLAPKYDPQELDEPADLSPEQKKRILDLFFRLDDLDHYTLLGITHDADKKGIKRAYFELAASFHPDRFFKKNLGRFKTKMEVLFTRITEAHDTLVDATKRADYNAYLAEVATTRGMEAMLERAMAESARAASQPDPTPPPAASAAPPAPAPRAASALSAEEIQRRKEALARRLTGGQRPPTPSRPAPEQPSPLRYSSSADAVDALKRRYEERVESATQTQAQRYIQSAEEALAKNDFVAASTAFALAVKLAPHDVQLAMKAQETKNRADAILCESYLKQAEYEERQGHFGEAAKSWSKVTKVRNDATTHARAASAILRAPDGDLHQAAEHAKQAIMLSPAAIDNHVILVEVYAKAGLTVSARRAAEAASALDPTNATILALMKRLGKR